MTKTLLKSIVALLVCLGLSAGYAFAQNHHDRDQERHERVEHRRAEVRHERIEHARWRREHAADHRPPGWDHGKKTGWRNCDVPPGQAKRNGCDMNSYYQRHPEWRTTNAKTPQFTAAQRDAWRQEQQKRRAEWLKQHPLPPQPAK